MTIVHSDQGTFLADRAQQAASMGPAPKRPVVLAGARVAIEPDRLQALQDAGHDQHAIVRRVNGRWERDNADLLVAHRGWVSRTYLPGLEAAKQAAARKAAEDMRRAAKLADLLGDDA